MGKAGRPFGTFKFDNADDLRNGVEQYFTNCKANEEPPTLEDLAEFLNISVKTLWNWGHEGYGDGSNADFLPTIQYAREKCINYATKRLYDKDGVNGAKFYLTNNSERMGGLRYADRQEVSMDIAPVSFVNNLED